jgi:hypothetical protein
MTAVLLGLEMIRCGIIPLRCSSYLVECVKISRSGTSTVLGSVVVHGQVPRGAAGFATLRHACGDAMLV